MPTELIGQDIYVEGSVVTLPVLHQRGARFEFNISRQLDHSGAPVQLPVPIKSTLELVCLCWARVAGISRRAALAVDAPN